MEIAPDHLGDLARRETSSPTACVIEPAWRLVQRQAHHAGIERCTTGQRLETSPT
jgi:hypothetical protein